MWISNHPELYEQLYLKAIEEAGLTGQDKQAVIERMQAIEAAIGAAAKKLRVRSNKELW